jgi:hypothetical protein
VVVMNVTIFWAIVPCSPLVNRRLGGVYHFHLAVGLVSFDIIILSILHRGMTYATSIHNNLDSLWL